MTLNMCIGFIQQQELIEKFNGEGHPNTAVTYDIRQTVEKCDYCGNKYEQAEWQEKY